MQKTITTFLLGFIFTQTFSQAKGKVSTYFLAQYNSTIYDRTIGNNPWGAGLGAQTFFNNRQKIKPTVEVTADIYLQDDKVARFDTDGTIPIKHNAVRGMANIFVGTSFNATRNIFLSFAGGASLISGQTLLGIKPSGGFYFSKSQKWIGKISYLNIFNRHSKTKEDFGSLSVAVGFTPF